MITLPEPLVPVVETLRAEEMHPVIVGGYVRDALLGHPGKDIDIEVYNATDLDALAILLAPFGSVNLVGKSFGVAKLSVGGFDIDFSLPRTESKTGSGHRGFDVSLDGRLDFGTAARRRDFTVNAMGYDIGTSRLLDPYGGQKDLEKGLLRCVSPQTFVEDPLRVLRAVQMAARFTLECDETLSELCRTMVDEGALDELPKERIFEEIRKLLLKAERPSRGLILMDRFGALKLFPELEAVRTGNTPDADAWSRTLESLDAMAALRTGETKRDLAAMLAVLCHACDAETGVRRFLARLSDDRELTETVAALVAHRDEPLRCYLQNAPAGDIRRLALKLPLELLLRVAKALHRGATSPSASFPAGEWLLAEALRVRATPEGLKPLLLGRDLIALGHVPSPKFKAILDRAYEAQLDGEYTTRESALKWLKNYST